MKALLRLPILVLGISSLISCSEKKITVENQPKVTNKIKRSKNDSLNVFDKYDFESGRFTLLAIADYPKNIPEEIGDFYIDDAATLVKLKKELQLPSKGELYKSSKYMYFHYNLLFLQEGVVKEHLYLNIDSNLLSRGNSDYEFSAQNLLKYRKQFKKPIVQEHSFTSLPEAQEYLSKVKKDNRFISYYESIGWSEFEGSFAIDYVTPNRQPISGDTVKNQIAAKIRNAYPNEPFKLEYRSLWNGIEYSFTIQCSKTLFDKFSIYKPYGWKKFSYPLVAYFKK